MFLRSRGSSSLLIDSNHSIDISISFLFHLFLYPLLHRIREIKSILSPSPRTLSIRVHSVKISPTYGFNVRLISRSISPSPLLLLLKMLKNLQETPKHLVFLNSRILQSSMSKMECKMESGRDHGYVHHMLNTSIQIQRKLRKRWNLSSERSAFFRLEQSVEYLLESLGSLTMEMSFVIFNFRHLL